MLPKLAQATHTFAATANLLDVDALKTTFATAETATVVNDGDWNGALHTGGSIDAAKVATAMGPCAAHVCVTTVAHAGAYNVTDPIVVTGTYGGKAQTANLQPTDADGGGLVFVTSVPFDLNASLSIAIPAQADDDGEFVIGWSGVAPPKVSDKVPRFAGLMGTETGALHLGYPDGTVDDALPTVAGREHSIAPNRIFGNSKGCVVYVEQT